MVEGQPLPPRPPNIQALDTDTTVLVPTVNVSHTASQESTNAFVVLLSRQQWDQCANGTPDSCNLALKSHTSAGEKIDSITTKLEEVLMEAVGKLPPPGLSGATNTASQLPVVFEAKLTWNGTEVAAYGPDIRTAAPSFPSLSAMLSLWRTAPVERMHALLQCITKEDGTVNFEKASELNKEVRYPICSVHDGCYDNDGSSANRSAPCIGCFHASRRREGR